ncbi:hypothetical protein NHH73_23425 [Oxalobacteraceae bacterium OTU3CINTB1]|nr:hypothetical protein NHH73_23425 [Oxalobacteraceae bacterium OTU3CINTB1]
MAIIARALLASHFGRCGRRFAAAPHSDGKKTTKYFDFIKDKSEMKLATLAHGA